MTPDPMPRTPSPSPAPTTPRRPKRAGRALPPVPAGVPRQRLPMAPVGRQVAALTRKAFSKFGFADDHVLTRWREIVGPELARLAVPERLSRPPRPRKSGGAGAVLTVRVAAAAAVEIQHMAPEILARINGFYGRPVVDRLKLVQGPLPQGAPPRRGAAAAPQTQATGATAETPPAGGADPLAAALARLERAVKADLSRGGGS